MDHGTHRLSLKERVGFSAGDAASNIFFQTFVLFITIFYTDVFGLPAAEVGTMNVNDQILATRTLGVDPIELESIRIVAAPAVTHLGFRILK